MKKVFYMLIVISCLLLTGCGKECVKWETTTIDERKDCSVYPANSNAKYTCEMINEKKEVKTVQECVAWE